MPNYCANTVTFTDTREVLVKIHEQLSRPVPVPDDDGEIKEVESPFSFWNIIAPALEIRDTYHATCTGAMFNNPDNWHSWNCDNWGTKWDAVRPELIAFEDETLEYRFETAWAPPRPALVALSTQYPTTLIEHWWEEDQGFGEELEYQAGVCEITREWDQPTCHKDFLDRDQTCWCSPDDWQYPDCPLHILDDIFSGSLTVYGTLDKDELILAKNLVLSGAFPDSDLERLLLAARKI